MIIEIAFVVLFLIVNYYFWMLEKVKQRLAKHVQLMVSYSIDESKEDNRDCRIKSGAIVISMVAQNYKLTCVLIKKIKIKHSNVYIRPILRYLVLSFRYYNGLTKSEVSVRYKILKKDSDTQDLTGMLTYISGDILFEEGNRVSFKVIIPISGAYQEQLEE